MGILFEKIKQECLGVTLTTNRFSTLPRKDLYKVVVILTAHDGYTTGLEDYTDLDDKTLAKACFDVASKIL